MAEERNETDQGQPAEPGSVYDLKQPTAEDQVSPRKRFGKMRWYRGNQPQRPRMYPPRREFLTKTRHRVCQEPRTRP